MCRVGHRLHKGLRWVGKRDPLELLIWDHYFASFDPWRVDGPIGRVLRDREDRRAAKIAHAAAQSKYWKPGLNEDLFMMKYAKKGRGRRKKETPQERDERVSNAVRAWAGKRAR